MKLSYIAPVILGLLATSAWAGEPESMTVQEVAELTGVKESSVRVLMGARSSPGRYPLNYYIAQRDYREAMDRIYDQGLALSVQGGRVLVVRVDDAARPARDGHTL